MHSILSRVFVSFSLAIMLGSSAQAALIITEVMSASGTNGTPDWFELTNTGAASTVITGYRMDDNSFAFGNSVLLNGVTSIAPGESVVFFESTTVPATEIANFRTFWSGSASGLPGVQIGYYLGSGAGVSFSSNGDGAVVYNAGGTVVAGPVSYPSATNGKSFQYDPGTQLLVGPSIVGQYGAFTSFDTTPLNTGSPGTIGSVPEPSTLALAGCGLLALGVCARRRGKCSR